MQSIDMFLETTREFLHQIAAFLPRLALALVVVAIGWNRSEERRVGKECERLCRSRWSPYH